MAQFDLNRAGDTPIPTLKLNEITPVNWHKFPPPIQPSNRAYVPVFTATGGAYGDDVAVSTANVIVDDRGVGDYMPRHQADKLSAGNLTPGTVMVSDVGSPRGFIDPSEPYGPAPVSPADDPVISTLSPSAGVSGGPPIWVTITGTKFTQWSSVETGGVVTPYSRYVSPTRIDMLQDPRSSPGTVVVKVIDHGVKSNGSNFTFS